MGIFSNSSPFDAEVEKATSEKNTSEEWGLIMDICDKVGTSSTNAKDSLRSIIKRLSNPDPHIAVQAITLLDACVSNCGKNYHLEIASRDFENEYRKLLSKSQPPIAKKLKGLLKKWSEGEFKSDPQLNLIPSLYAKLKSEGVDFNDVSDMPTKKPEKRMGAVAMAQTIQKEQEDLARAIELSLQENKQSSPRNSANSTTSKTSSSLYPSMSQMASSSTPSTAAAAPQQEARKVRALYDFEAAEDNELTFLAGEIIHLIDSSDPNWWKGYNQRGEGLFPANFVTSDLSVEPQSLKAAEKKTVQFNESVEVKKIDRTYSPNSDEPVEINEAKIDRLLSLLHEANPEDSSTDTDEMLQLESEVNRMGPLIDQELEKVDRKHARLTQLSADLVDALNLYHTLMREPANVPMKQPQYPAQMPPGMYNGHSPYPNVPGMPAMYMHPQHPAGPMMNAGVMPPHMGIPPGMMSQQSHLPPHLAQMGPQSQPGSGAPHMGQPGPPGAMGQPPQVGVGQPSQSHQGPPQINPQIPSSIPQQMPFSPPSHQPIMSANMFQPPPPGTSHNYVM